MEEDCSEKSWRQFSLSGRRGRETVTTAKSEAVHKTAKPRGEILGYILGRKEKNKRLDLRFFIFVTK